MRELFRAAWVIGRRDYVATVFSRAFLLFLVGPLVLLLFGVVFSLIGTQGERPGGGAAALVAIADAGEGDGLTAAAARIGGRPPRIVPPAGAPRAQAERLLADGAQAVLAGGLDHPVLIGRQPGLADAADDAARLVDQARQARALARAGAAPPPLVGLGRLVIAPAASEAPASLTATARAGQTAIWLLTTLLAGMLLSNLLEEKSSKVIEILAAAVPIDAIFLGKLFGMLAISLTGITVWSSIGIVVTLALGQAHAGGDLALTPPAVGWPMFVLFGLLYFTMTYLLLGAVFLGIGAQARSVREVQTISMPVTMGQLLVFAFSSAAIGAPDGRTAWAAMLFPWSSPFAMMARAAELPALWPHLLGFLWQALWVMLAIRLASRLFRRSVLNAGAGASVRKRRA